jgi:hypothetical protein
VGLGKREQKDASDLELARWDGVYQYEIKALEGLCTGMTPRGGQVKAPSDTVCVVTA